MFCQQCGAQLPEDVKFCPKCGQQTKQEKFVPEISKSKAKRKYWIFILIIIIGVGIGEIVFRTKTDLFMGIIGISEEKTAEYEEGEQAVTNEEQEKSEKCYLLKAEYVYDIEDNLISRYEYEYDLQGNQIKGIKYDEKGELEYWFEDKYNKQGDCIESIRRDAEGNIQFWDENQYNMQGKVVRYISYQEDGKVEGWQECVYDVNGMLGKFLFYDAEGNRTFGWCEKRYDEKGNCIEDRWYGLDGSIGHWTEYIYDDQSNLIKINNHNHDGVILSGEERKYDENNNCIKSINYGNENVTGWTEYSYDSQRNCISYVNYDVDEEILSRVEREYVLTEVLVEKDAIFKEREALLRECQKIYVQFGKEYMMNHAEQFQIPRFCLAYMNNDEVPELLIVDGDTHPDKVKIYTYNQGVVEPLVNEYGEESYGATGCIYYAEKTGNFYSHDAGMGEENYYFYEIQGNNVIKTKEIYTIMNVPEESVDYYVDGTLVTEETYKQALDNMLNEIFYQRIGYSENGIDISNLIIEEE